MSGLEGKSILITGASLGIGRESALRFAAGGCSVALTYRKHRAEAEQAARRCLGLGAHDAFATSLQLTDEGDVCRAVDEVVRRFGGLDVLINNAGVISWRPFVEQDSRDIDEQVLVNLIHNAIKYSPEGGRIGMEVRRESSSEGPRAVVSVHDQGIGIPEK